MRIALGLYTVYEDLKKDLEKTLFNVRAMGYGGVEFYGPCLWEPERVRKALEANGLAICGWHVEWKLLTGENSGETLNRQAETGNPAIVIPCLGGPWNVGHTKEEDCQEIWERYTVKINSLSEKTRALGMRLGYHTHAHEFETRFAGGSPWEIFLEHLDREIFLELDTGNCLEGGGNPKEALKQARGRLYTIHCKPFGKEKREQAQMGSSQDDNPWKDIIREAKLGGAEWLAVEDEGNERDKMALAKRDGETIAGYLKEIKAGEALK